MGFSVVARELGSRIIREQVTGGDLVRSMDLSSIVSGLATADIDESGGNKPGFWGSLWKGAKSLLAGAWKLVAGIVGFSCRKLVEWLIKGVEFLWRFDWNIQSAQVDWIQEQAIINIAGAIGGVLGSLAGTVVGGVIPGLVLLKFNKALGLHALQELKDEVLDDIVNELSLALTATAANLARVAALRAYIGLRNATGKAWAEGAKKLAKAGIISPEAAKAAEEQTKSVEGVVSFQRKFQDGVEKLPEWGQEFIEEFVEEFSDKTKDCMLIIAGAVDSFYAQTATMENTEALQAVVEIDFNRSTNETPDPDTSD